MTASHSRALVLGGGGITGIAWETGLLLGLERHGLSLRAADLIVGTSAGSVVAAQIGGPTSLEDLYDAQVANRAAELAVKLGLVQTLKLVFALRGTRDERAALAKVGDLAVRTSTVEESARTAVIAQRLPIHTWPAGEVKITAVNARTGEFAVFDKSSGIDLVLAVAASCAVPLVWPPITIGTERYIDGGMRSVANVDLAAGFDPVIVIAPQTVGLRKGSAPAQQLARLGASSSLLVSPDAEARRSMGNNSLDPTARAGSAVAGLEQADRVAATVSAAWA